MKRISCVILVFIVSFSAVSAQDGFLSRLFFPVTFGLSFPLTDTDRLGRFITSEGVEYRFNDTLPVFTRISYDNLSFRYSILPNPVTNAVKSEFDASIATLGVGLRTSPGKLRFSGMGQAGVMNYRFPLVSVIPSGFEVTYTRRNKFTLGAVASVEYYFVKDFGAIVEVHFMYSPFSDILWGKDFHYAGIRLGITAVLF
jgi:hypothetical protein